MPAEHPPGHHRRTRRLHRARACATLLATLALLPYGAAAEGSFVSLSQSTSRDSNVLRLSDDTATPAGYQRADTVNATSLAAGFDQGFGRQRGFGTVALRSQRFGANGVFDHDAYSLSAGLDAATVGRLSGSLNVGAGRSLASFGLQELGLLGRKNFEDTRNADLVLRVGLVTAWTAELGYGRREVRNTLDDAGVQGRDFDTNNRSVGLRWRAGGATTLGLAWRDTAGRYPRFRRAADGSFAEDRFRGSGSELTAEFEPAGASRLVLRIGDTRTRYELNAARDFSGVTGALEWTWRPTGKLTLSSSLSRTTGQDSTAAVIQQFAATSDYSRVTRALRLRADWNVSAKALVFADLNRSDRNLVRTIALGNSSFDGGSGTERGISSTLGARWLPLRWLSLGCEFSRLHQRGAGDLGQSIGTRAASCSAQLALQ